MTLIWYFLSKIYVFSFIAMALFVTWQIVKAIIVKMHKEKISEFVNLHFSHLFKNERFMKNPVYENIIDRNGNQCFRFTEFNDYVNMEVKPFHVNFLNESVREKLKDLVFKKLEIFDKKMTVE